MRHQGVKIIFFPKSPISVLIAIWSYFFSPLKVFFIVNCLHLMCFFPQSSHSMLVHFKSTTLDKRKILSINHQLHTHPVHQIKVLWDMIIQLLYATIHQHVAIAGKILNSSAKSCKLNKHIPIRYVNA